MKIFYIFCILTLIKTGHIYVSEPQMFYVNKGYIKSVGIMFKL